MRLFDLRIKMEVVNYFDSSRQEHWRSRIEESDWRAGPFLAALLRNGTFFETVGEHSRVLLLTDGEELLSYCTYAEKDDIQPTDLTPWVGFVYTFPAHRGHRYAGLLFEEVVRLAREENVAAVYLSTNHTGLYEKYGWEYLKQLDDMDGNPSRIYVKKIRTFAVRQAVPADEERIRELFLEMMRTIHPAEEAKGYEDGYLDKFWKRREDRIYLAADGKDVAAFLSVEVYRSPQEYIYLDDLSVTETYRNQGIGQTLIKTAEDYAASIGIPDILFHVEKGNRDARRLYERLGYRIFRDDGNRYLMHKKEGKTEHE